MSNFENKIIIIIKKKRQSKSSNTINLYIYLSVLKLLSKIDVYMFQQLISFLTPPHTYISHDKEIDLHIPCPTQFHPKRFAR